LKFDFFFEPNIQSLIELPLRRTLVLQQEFCKQFQNFQITKFQNQLMCKIKKV